MSKKKSKAKQDEEAYQIAKEDYLRQLRTAQAESIKQFDTQILYISSGALLLSITFIGDVVKLEVAVWTGVLIFSWILLATTVILSVLSHLSSYHQHENAIKRVEEDEELLDDRFNRNLNRLVAVFFLAGIGALIIFATINLEHMKSDKSNVTPETKIIAPDSVAINPLVIGSDKLGAPVQTAPKALFKPADSSKAKK